MRQHMSVFMLFAKSSFYKVLILLLAMIAAEGAWFYKTLLGLQEKRQLEGKYTVVLAEAVFEDAHLMGFFAVAVIGLTVILAYVGRSTIGHQEYTWNRLSITPTSIFLWQTLYNTGCFLLLWFVQAALAFSLCLYYVKTAEAGAVTHQSLFLAFYREPFLHGLIPLQNTWYWVRNVLFFVALGFSTAYDVSCARQGKNRMWTWWMILGLGLAKFKADLSMNGTDGMQVLIYAGIVLWMVFILLRMGERRKANAGNEIH